MKLQFPIRFKIVLLILVALSVSLLAYMYVGTQLLVEDKISYIYDYTLAEVKSASEKVDSQLQKISQLGKMVGGMVRGASPGPSGKSAAADTDAPALALYDQYAKELGIGGGLLLAPVDPAHFSSRLELGDGRAPSQVNYAEVLSQLGWAPSEFEKQSVLIGAPIQLPGAQGPADASIPIGVRTTSSDGKPLAFFTLCKLDQALSKDGGKNYEIRLMDSLGKTLLAKPAAGGAVTPGQFEAFAGNLIQGTFDSGVRDWSAGGKDYITSYQRLASKRLTVVSLIAKDTAYAAARALVVRSLFMGLSILLLAVGVAIVVARGMTGKLREMWRATLKVGEGDFTVRVDARKLPRDEVGGLAVSFNVMADKIGELMLQTAKKARMEKELETAQAVQRLFFPEKSFEHASMRLSGQYVPASECAGDWWHYACLGSRLIVVVGDVTGHGVSAALVTAAAHSTFMLIMKQYKAAPERPFKLEVLISALNSAVIASAGGKSTMTFVASVIDLQTGVMLTSSASHPPSYVYRKPPGQASGGNPVRNFKPMIAGRIPPLGDAPEIRVETETYQLRPGDHIFWYTDGIVESRPSDGEQINKSKFLRLLASKSDDAQSPAEQICGAVMDETLRFFGPGAEDRPDDITLVVATISPDAKFAGGEESVAEAKEQAA